MKKNYCYKNGMKFNLADNSQIHGVTVIGDREYVIGDNAPTPFVYGVKTICLVYSSNGFQKWYDVLTNKYHRDNNFKGEEVTKSIDTCPHKREEWYTVKLKRKGGKDGM